LVSAGVLRRGAAPHMAGAVVLLAPVTPVSDLIKCAGDHGDSAKLAASAADCAGRMTTAFREIEARQVTAAAAAWGLQQQP
jgi:hypothetical protein